MNTMKFNLKNTILFRFFDPNYLWESVHPAAMGMVRIAFGYLMYFQMAKFDFYFTGYLSKSKYLMHYDYFEWIEMMPEDWWPVFFGLMYASVVLIALGLFFRPAMLCFFFGMSYCFLIDKGHYNNHYYMLCLLSFWMIFTHWNRWGSIDHWIAGKIHREDRDRAGLLGVLWQKRDPRGIPRWHLLVPQLLVFIVYFYGMLAKLNPDWLEGYPMRIWMEQRADWKYVGPMLDSEAFALFISYSGIFFDGLVGFILLSRNLRLKIFFLLFFILPFHVMNDFLWKIGIFPETMLALTLLFFDPALPQRLIDWLRAKFKKEKLSWKATANEPSVILPFPKTKKLVMIALSLFFFWQLTFPLRVILYPRPVEWHTNAQHFSWRMMLTDREAAIRLRVVVNGELAGYIHIEDYVTERQYAKFVKDPPEIVRFTHFIKAEMQRQAGISNPEIYVDYWRSINGRPYQMVILPTVNLCEAPYHRNVIQDWLLPFQNTEKKKKNFNLLTDEETRNMGLFQ